MVQGRPEVTARSRFDDALRRARGAADAPRGRPAARRPVARGTAAAAKELAALDGGGPGRLDARGTAAADPARSGAFGDLAPVPEIAALIRTLPAVAVARARDGASLALSVGRSLEVELRAGAAGVDVVLRPEPPLARAAEAELPRVVAALRERGVAVGRAEVRTRGDRRRAR